MSNHGPNLPYKTCSCGRTYTLAEWIRLPPAAGGLLGDDGLGGLLQFRNCVCRSTLTMPVRVSMVRRVASAVIEGTEAP